MELYPAAAPKNFDIPAVALGEQLVDNAAEGFLAAHPADKAIDIPSPPSEKKREPVTTTFSVTSTQT